MNDLVFSIDKRRIIAFNIPRDKIREKPNVELLPYGPTGTKMSSRMPSAQPQTNEIYCPNCSSEVKFIEEYRRWYCYQCRQYVAPTSKEKQKIVKPTLEAQSQGSPYKPYSPSYSPYQPKSSTPYIPSKTTTQIQPDLNQEVQKPKMEFAKKPDDSPPQELSSPGYYMPLDLEADLDYGAVFFNDLLKIKHIILIHSQSGVPLFSQGFGKEIDVSLTSGFLSAVGTFTEEMAGETEKRIGVFSEIGREGFWIIIYEGYQSKAAFLVSEKIGSQLKERVVILMKEFEQKYANELENFSGFVSAFSNTTDLLEKHLRVEYLYPLKVDVKRMRLTAISPNEKKIAKCYSDFIVDSDDEVFYISELLNVLFNGDDIVISKEDALKVIIKYLENSMLIPLPPPPEQQF